MRAVEKYLSKILEELIEETPSPDLGIVVTIPAFNEAETIKSIDSLLSCHLPKTSVEILININFSENVTAPSKLFNKTAFTVLDSYAKQHSTDRLKIHTLYFPNQDAKIAGVGWARKQVMDEAFRRLLSVGNENGIITGFDADSTCKRNYFTELEHFFANKPKATACSIRFEHPIKGIKYSPEIYQAITLYELHLRYFINAQKLIGAPFAYQTVGSSFAVRAKNYAQVNGMSPKKAGEDFYFLQKVIALGNFHQLNTTCVYPSSRISNRVGFGTGPSVGEIAQTGQKQTYNFKSFLEIKKLYDALPNIYNNEILIENLNLHPLFIEYLHKQKSEQTIINLRRNNKSYEKFRDSFMQWFGGFQVLKILNILRATPEFQDEDIVSAINKLQIIKESNKPKELLEEIRLFDKNS